MNRQQLEWLHNRFSSNQLFSDPSECVAYSYDNSQQCVLPQAVVFPVNTHDVQDLILFANDESIPVTPRGRGTGTPGGSVPIKGGIVLSFEKMTQLMKIDRENRYAIAQPGLTNANLQNALSKEGFFWPPDPSSAHYCSIGGNLAYNSAGPRAIKYGTPRENTLGLTAITGDGKYIKTGVYTTKGVVGYDLTRLLIGSEGTLAVITEATLKILPLAQTKRTIRAVYRSVESAAQAVSSIMAQPITPCALEFMDSHCLSLISNTIDLPAGAKAMLLIEVDGAASTLQYDLMAISIAAKHKDLLSIEQSNSPTESERLWHARKALSPAQRKIAPHKINEDVVVPVANIPSLLKTLTNLSSTYGITILSFGHAGNGNLHVNILTDLSDPELNQNAQKCLQGIFKRVLELDGTLSGEHGIGLEKRQFIESELGLEAIDIMQRTKTLWDPKGILNPGKIFPPFNGEC